MASAQALNRLLHGTLPEAAAFWMGHFLGKQPVQSILGLRLAHRGFEPLWNRTHIARVEIIRDGRQSLEDRVTSYDSAGALRDLIQNHLRCLTVFEHPVRPASVQPRGAHLERREPRPLDAEASAMIRRFAIRPTGDRTSELKQRAAGRRS